MKPIGRFMRGKLVPAAMAAGIALSSLGYSQSVQAADANLKMAFFASPKHPVWSVLMDPWGEKVSATNVGLKIAGLEERR